MPQPNAINIQAGVFKVGKQTEKVYELRPLSKGPKKDTQFEAINEQINRDQEKIRTFTGNMKEVQADIDQGKMSAIKLRDNKAVIAYDKAEIKYIKHQEVIARQMMVALQKRLYPLKVSQMNGVTQKNGTRVVVIKQNEYHNMGPESEKSALNRLQVQQVYIF